MNKGSVALWTIAVLFIAFLLSGSAFAFHPLITDDTGTQGKGKFQLEVNGQSSHDNNNGTKTNETELLTALTYGIVDTVDVAVGMPYRFIRVKDAGNTISNDGFSDLAVDVKWRFFEHEGLSFALKPGVTLPTGNKDDDLGTGRTTYHLFLITTKEIKPWAFHLNLGYIRNENKIDERKDLWHASLASELELSKHIKAAANIGIEHTRDAISHTDPAFALMGLVYSFSENLDIDFGIKAGLNKAEPDYTALAGITIKF